MTDGARWSPFPQPRDVLGGAEDHCIGRALNGQINAPCEDVRGCKVLNLQRKMKLYCCAVLKAGKFKTFRKYFQ